MTPDTPQPAALPKAEDPVDALSGQLAAQEMDEKMVWMRMIDAKLAKGGLTANQMSLLPAIRMMVSQL